MFNILAINNKRIISLIRFSLAIVILFILFYTKRLDYRCFGQINLNIILAPLTFYLISFFIGIYRWWFLIRSMGLSFSLWDVARLAMTGIWFSSVLPGGSIAAGDIARAAFFTIENPKLAGAALSSVFMDRLLGLFAIISIAGFALVTNPKLVMSNVWLQAIGISLIIITFIASMLIIVLTSKRLTRKIDSINIIKKLPFQDIIVSILKSFRAYSDCPRTLMKGFLISCLGHMSMILAIYIIAIYLGIYLPSLSAYLFAISIGITASMIPISGPAGIGVGNVAFALTFNLVNSDRGAELAIFWQITFILASQIGLPFFLIGKRE